MGLSNLSINVVPAKKVLPYVLDKLGSTQVWTSQSPTEFDLVYRLESLSSLHTDAFGLHGVAALYMPVRLYSEILYGDWFQPTVDIKALAHHKQSPQPLCSVVLSQITKMIDAFFADYWPCQSQLDTLEFLPNFYRHVQARIPLLGNFCVVCGCLREQIGLKPLPCNKETCNTAFNKQGTGTDLRDIYSRPVIAELLISMASAACRCKERREHLFKGMPSSTFSIESEADWWCLIEAVEGTPAMAVMAKQPNLQKFLSNMAVASQVGMQRFRMLRWVLNSCQGHLMQLQGEDMFTTVATKYQFRLCTDRPSKEAAFSQLKEKHGSQFLFHGSPFYNWHSILQNGLQNLSNTSLMSCGNAHGPGIYLAESSELAARHCNYETESVKSAYANSTFGNMPYCLSLCEVINDSFNSLTNAPGASQRVVPDSGRVITRYLFVYKNSDSLDSQTYADERIPHLQASTLRDVCERHAQTQAVIQEAVKKACRIL